jgi:ankyrin repeat protein
MAALLLRFDNITMCCDIISLALQDPTRVEILRLLLQRFPDCESPEYPLLFDAARAGNVEAVRLLVEVRPPGYIGIKDEDGYTALFACNTPDMVRLLLELGADPRAADINGQTPIMACINPACVRLLLDAAPDQVSIRDDEGRTAMMHLSRDYHHEALEELFRYCEEHGIDDGVNNKAKNGDTALHMAMASRNPRAVKLLLDKGAEVLGSRRDSMTVLMEPFVLLHPPPTKSIEIDVWQTDTNSWWKAVLDTSVCLKAVLEAVLAHGAEAADEDRDPYAKRRKTNKQ